MSRLVRQICIGLAVTLMVTLQGFAVRDGQHRLEHALQFPGVAFSDSAADHKHHDDGHDHAHEAEAEIFAAADAAIDAVDQSEMPVLPHHHHGGGGDVHIALAGLSQPNSPSSGLAPALNPARTPPLAGTRPESPLDPPKQNA